MFFDVKARDTRVGPNAKALGLLRVPFIIFFSVEKSKVFVTNQLNFCKEFIAKLTLLLLFAKIELCIQNCDPMEI